MYPVSVDELLLILVLIYMDKLYIISLYTNTLAEDTGHYECRYRTTMHVWYCSI